MSQSITLTAQQWRDLIAPVLPFASNDDMLPVLNAVNVRTDGKWLIATATDRFRVAMKRIKKHATDDDSTTEWPEFAALIPLKAVKSISAMLKPTRNGSHLSGATFTAEDGRLTVEASGLFDLFDSARFTHHLETDEFPEVESIFIKALAVPDEERSSRTSINPAFLAGFKACGATVLRVLSPAADDPKRSPLIVLDDNGFIGLLMPRTTSEVAESWDDVLAPKPAAKPARKSRAKKAVA